MGSCLDAPEEGSREESRIGDVCGVGGKALAHEAEGAGGDGEGLCGGVVAMPAAERGLGARDGEDAEAEDWILHGGDKDGATEEVGA